MAGHKENADAAREFWTAVGRFLSGKDADPKRKRGHKASADEAREFWKSTARKVTGRTSAKASSGASRSTRGKVSAKSGASRSTRGKTVKDHPTPRKPKSAGSTTRARKPSSKSDGVQSGNWVKVTIRKPKAAPKPGRAATRSAAKIKDTLSRKTPRGRKPSNARGLDPMGWRSNK